MIRSQRVNGVGMTEAMTDGEDGALAAFRSGDTLFVNFAGASDDQLRILDRSFKDNAIFRVANVSRYVRKIAAWLGMWAVHDDILEAGGLEEWQDGETTDAV